MNPYDPYIFAVKNIQNLWCVYAHECNDCVIYIGSGTLARAFAVGPQDRTDWWREVVKNQTVKVGIVALYERREAALAAEKMYIERCKPVANIQHCAVPKKRGEVRPVVCIDDNRIFPSVSRAARTYGVSQSAISNVASGRFPSVKGMRFRYLR